MPTVYLVSGANRGIGLALVKALASKPDVVVFAGVRQPDAPGDLPELSKKHPDKVRILKLTSADEADNRAAVEEIRKTVGRLDVVIPNAGISNWFGPGETVPLESMREHFEVNSLGVLALFQATYPLLKASTPAPKFVPISARIGSVAIGVNVPLQNINYGASKAAANYIVRKLRRENEGLICFPICPGLVDTDMSSKSLATLKAPLEGHQMKTTEYTAEQVLARIDEGTRETDQFLSYDGTHIPW